jgi:hypothetical protein
MVLGAVASSKEQKVMTKRHLPKTDASTVNVADYIIERG